MRLFFSIFLLLALQIPVTGIKAQMPGGSSMHGEGKQVGSGHFYGKLVDDFTGKVVEGASVQLLQNKWDSASRRRTDHVISIKVSDKRGEFSIEGLAVTGSFKLKVIAIGFRIFEKNISFELNIPSTKNGDFQGITEGVDKDLGNLKLTPEARELSNVTVTGTKQLVELNLDKRVYNVEKDISATGGTALDVMKNVPSVNVDLDGNVTVRNAVPQLFIDGRPSAMTLDQIPADQIASVEVMSNPTARYDASGGGGGIVNIVLKKDRRSGYNGNLRAGIDSRGRPGGGGNINLRHNKVNLFAAGMFNMRKSVSEVNSSRTDYPGNATAHMLQDNDPINRGVYIFGRLGIDYFIDNRNTVTVSGNISGGSLISKDVINLYRDTVKASSIFVETGIRNIRAVNDFRYYGAAMSFKHNFARAGKELTADISYNHSKNYNTSDYNSRYFDASRQQLPGITVERSSGGGESDLITFQSDLVNPYGRNRKLEAGVRMTMRKYNSNNDNFLADQSGNYIYIPSLNVKYKYLDVVYAAYATYTQQVNNFSYQFGLRLERSDYDGELTNKLQLFTNNYPVSVFPGIYLTQKLNKREDLQFSYSRKINRPNFFQLIPFIDFSDSLNLTVGNPALIPEFTNQVELTYQRQFNPYHSLQASIYGRLSNGLITRYQYRDANPNPSKTDSVLFNTYVNADKSYNYGIELIGRNRLMKWWDMTANLNIFQAIIKAGNLQNGLDKSLASWFVKVNNNFKLPGNFSLQVSGDYQARSLVPLNSGNRAGNSSSGGGGMFGSGPQPTAQGYIKPFYGIDIAIKKDFLKNNAASITLQLSDVIRTKKYATYTDAGYFLQDYSRRRDPQVLRLNFTWRFGKLDATLVKRKNMKGEMENMQNLQGQGQ